MKTARKNVLLMAAAITFLLVMGIAIAPMQSYASGEHKKTGDFKSSIKATSQIDKKSASQKLDQDNFCYRGDDCQQANQGQQITGKDNEASGFNDQSRNLQSTPATAGAAGGTGNGTTPTPKTCLECFTTILTPDEIAKLESYTENTPISEICQITESGEHREIEESWQLQE